MFDGLQGKLQNVFRQLRGEGRVTAETLDAALRQIRFALLEADVHVRVVKPFVERIRERAIGEHVLASLTPAQQVIKIVRDELVVLLGEEGAELRLDARPSVVVLCGLQGSGKTTTCGKLAKKVRGQGRHPLLVAGDLQRAAAVDQLEKVGAAVGVAVLRPEPGEAVLELAKRAKQVAATRGHDVIIFDTAGRLHVDEALMRELKGLVSQLEPREILFVADSMTGQDAVRSAGAFAEALPLTGVILTKLDGDSRGGAALSIRTVAKVPIRFLGMGEKAEDLEVFRPDRMASRILGMGDVLSLIEKAEQGLDLEESKRLADKMIRREMTLEDLRDQLRQLKKLGPLSSLLELMPKVGPLKGLDASMVDDRQLRVIESIIDSMTPRERREPRIIDASRKRRIAKGSGRQVQDVNQLLKQYQMMQKMMKGAKGKWMKRAFGGR